MKAASPTGPLYCVLPPRERSVQPRYCILHGRTVVQILASCPDGTRVDPPADMVFKVRPAAGDLPKHGDSLPPKYAPARARGTARGIAKRETL